MIDVEIEKFTAQEAAELGLIDAVASGDAVVEGHYTITQDGVFEFKQRNFSFRDKAGIVHFGRFTDNYALMDFAKIANERLNGKQLGDIDCI